MQTQLLQDSYQKQIASLFNAGEKLTVMSTLYKVGTIELRHFVSELKKQGMDIKSKWTSSNGKRFKIYELNKPQNN